VSYRGAPQRYTGGYVTHDFFRVIGVEPVLGRNFTAADNTPGADRVVLLSHEIWAKDFGKDPNIVGTSLRTNGKPATVIGVMPPRFKFPVSEQLWVPLWNEFPPRPRDDPKDLGVGFMGRLKPGVSLDQASAEFTALGRRIAEANPKTNSRFTVAQLQPLSATLVGRQTRQVMYLMLGAVVVVLLIACVNVMNMQFARATLRTKELAVRGALGATRWRLVRQMLTESLLLAGLGAVLGVVLADWCIRLVADATQGLQFPLPYWVSFELDPVVLGVTLGTTLLAALVSGLMPALLTSRANPAEVMKDSGRGNSSNLVSEITAALVVAQVALTAALLVISVLQIRSVINRVTLHYGYDETAVLTARLGLFDADYPTPEARQKFFTAALRQLRAAPEIASAALTARFQMVFAGNGQYEVDGQSYVTDDDRPVGNFEPISDGYFDVLGLRIIEGRDFRPDDSDAKQPVALVNASFARKHFGNASPIGRQVRVYNKAQPQAWRTIVGVVSDTLMQGPLPAPGIKDGAGFYQLMSTPPTPQFSTLIVRPRPGQRPESLGAVLRRELAGIDPNLPLYFVGTPKVWHDGALTHARLIATLFGAFGLVAVVLSSVGLYGVMSFSVNQRTQEFGIRMALGADASRIVFMVVRRGALQLFGGLIAGLALAVALALLIRARSPNFFFQIEPTDPVVYGGVAALLALVATLACLVPARRATRVDPMRALRAE
jgi:predicted permease